MPDWSRELSQRIELPSPEGGLAAGMARFHRWALAARKLGGSRLLRQKTVRLPGGGAEPTGLRDYAPGDEFRYIDWRICGRRDEILSKTFECKQNRPISILVDCSQSMACGQPSKLDVARRIAAALGTLALADENRVRLFSFAGRLVSQSPQLLGESQILRWLRLVEQIRPVPGETNLAAAADALARGAGRAGLCIVISDLFEPAGYQAGFDRLLQAGFDLRLVHLYASEETDPRQLGDVELVDVETPDAPRRATLTQKTLQQYRAAFARFLESVRTSCRRHRIAFVQTTTDAAADALLETILKREAV